MFKMILYFFIFISTFLHAYESEDKLKVVIIGKTAKYITCKENNLDTFVITVLRNPYGELFDEVYKDKKIKSKPVIIKYIDDINDLGESDILYIPKVSAAELSDILQHTENQNILTVSDTRGFAQKGGIIQLYFVSQRLKLKINTHSANLQNIKIKPTLLRIAEVVKGNKT